MKHTGRMRPGLCARQGCTALCGMLAQAARPAAQPAGCRLKEDALVPFRLLGDAGFGHVDRIPVTRRPPLRAVQQQP